MRAGMRGAHVLAIAAAVFAGACGGYATAGDDETPAPSTPALTTVQVDLWAEIVEIGQATGAKASSFDQNGAPIPAGAATFSSSAPEVAGVNPATGTIIAISAGTTQITGTIDGKSGVRTLTVFKPAVRLNEVKPDGNDSLGWIELYNPTPAAVDVSGWTVSTSDIYGGFTLPSGVMIPAGGFRVINEIEIPGGLHAAGAVHVFSRFGVQLDSFQWTADPTFTYGRCPDGTGPFVPNIAITRGGVNACG